MRVVATKRLEQQSGLMLHRTRHLFIRQQTAVINAIRAHLAEFGSVAPVGRNGVEQLLGVVADSNDKRLPEVARACVAALGAQLRMLKAQILEFDRQIMAGHRSNEMSQRLDKIPGVGPALATALVAIAQRADRSGSSLRVAGPRAAAPRRRGGQHPRDYPHDSRGRLRGLTLIWPFNGWLSLCRIDLGFPSPG
jgi:transposase